MVKIKNFIKNKIRGIFEIGNGYFIREMKRIEYSLSQLEQRRLAIYYQQLKEEKKFLPNIKDVGFRVFSQNDEDGILLYIFSLIGSTNKICLDIAFSSPYGANTTNLICNHGWNGLLICGSEKEKKCSEGFFAKNEDSLVRPPKIIHKWVTTENINEIILNSGLKEEIDLFCLDIDGVDYWIWKAINVVRPRVVVVEFHSIWGSSKAVTVPYKPNFNRFDFHEDFLGASLAAFVKLASEKGYRLVGCNKYCFNAFFIKKGVGEDVLPEISAENCFKLYSQPTWTEEKRKKRLENVKAMDWVEV